MGAFVKALLFLGAGLLSACQGAEQIRDPLNYEIIIDGQTPSIAHATLNLTNSKTPLQTLYLRGDMMGVSSQISNVECEGDELVQNTDMTWVLPATCGAVNWTITFSTQAPSSYQPSGQQSLFVRPDWWLVSGPSSLLRISGNDEDAKTIGFTLPDKTRKNYQLQGVNAPPNFYNLGNPPSRSLNNGTDSLNYIGDDLGAVLSIISPEDHLKAIEYLRSVIGSSARTVERLDVNWFGAPRERREASGAAGYDTILANYIISEDQPKREEQLLSLMLIFHEQFHQLDNGAHPVWMGESLANFYALKALRKIYPDDQAASLVWDRFITIDQPVDISLTQIQSEISNDNNRQNYGLLYTQGVSFWHELDIEIQKNSGGQDSLDTLIHKIMALDLNSQGGAWQKIKPLFAMLPASKLNEIENKYFD